jgi:putative Holliday junction resolvase
VSDESASIAFPFRTVNIKLGQDPLGQIVEAAREVGAGELVVGLPRRLDGAKGPEAKAAQELARRLGLATKLKVALADERLSSAQADRSLLDAGVKRAGRRQVTDQVAAVLILQNYLAKRPNDNR